jgi:hypothetical protein
MTSDTKFDDSSVIQFLSAASAALAKTELLTSRDLDTLRAFLRPTSRADNPVQQNIPLLGQLEHRQEPAFQLMTTLLGRSAIVRNILRYDLRAQLINVEACYTSIAKLLVEKAALHFNRPATIYFDGEVEGVTLLSTPTLELANLIALSITDLTLTREFTERYVASAWAQEDSEIDSIYTDISAAMGFSTTCFSGLPFVDEMVATTNIKKSIHAVSIALEGYVKLLRKNYWGRQSAETLLHCEQVRKTVENLDIDGFTQTNDFSTWELRRSSYHKTLDKTFEGLEQVRDGIEDLLGNSPSMEKNEGKNNVVRRHVFTQLVRDGISTAEASDACKSLINYFDQFHTNSAELLQNEAHKINEHLSHAAIDRAKKAEELYSVSAHAPGEKQANHKILMDLKKFLGLSMAVLLGMFSVGNISSCGLKGSPKSSLSDPRPSIPFRTPPNQPLPHEGD